MWLAVYGDDDDDDDDVYRNKIVTVVYPKIHINT